MKFIKTAAMALAIMSTSGCATMQNFEQENGYAVKTNGVNISKKDVFAGAGILGLGVIAYTLINNNSKETAEKSLGPQLPCSKLKPSCG